MGSSLAKEGRRWHKMIPKQMIGFCLGLNGLNIWDVIENDWNKNMGFIHGKLFLLKNELKFVWFAHGQVKTNISF